MGSARSWCLTIACVAALALLHVVATGTVQAAEEPDIPAILAALDEQSNFADTDFSAVMTMITQDPDKGLEKLVVRQFRRDAQDKFLLLIEEPSTQRGQGYLRDGESLWFYDPESRKFSHTSLKESFEGSDARNSDFAQSRLSDDYQVSSYSAGTLGKYAVYIIDLEAVNAEVTYPYLKIWVTQGSNLLLKSESYSLTQRLMRTALFPSYARVGDSVVPRQMLFVDELVEGKRTQITLTQLSVDPLSDNVFTKAFVERVNR